MPGLVPAEPDDREAPANRLAWDVLKQWSKPFLVAFSDKDPITGPMAPLFTGLIPGAQGRTHPTLEGAGHFLQEDAGPQLAEAVVRFITEHPVR
jgi:haloalkane dehalogenase